jgi:hypothetical protein
MLNKPYIGLSLSFRLDRSPRATRRGENLSGTSSEGFPTCLPDRQARFACPHTGGFAEENGNDTPLIGRITPVIWETPQ